VTSGPVGSAYYVPATRCDDDVPDHAGRLHAVRVDEPATLPALKGKRFSCGAGAHGQRLYDWARLPVGPVWHHGFGHWILARRSISDPTEIAYYVCHAPRAHHADPAGAHRRTTVARRGVLHQSKNQAGLDRFPRYGYGRVDAKPECQ
jgi:hypothetical protein